MIDSLHCRLPLPIPTVNSNGHVPVGFTPVADRRHDL